jgi:hypothetical protein
MGLFTTPSTVRFLWIYPHNERIRASVTARLGRLSEMLHGQRMKGDDSVHVWIGSLRTH